MPFTWKKKYDKTNDTFLELNSNTKINQEYTTIYIFSLLLTFIHCKTDVAIKHSKSVKKGQYSIITYHLIKLSLQKKITI